MNCPSARSSRAEPFFQDHEARARKFSRSLEIHLTECFAELEMLFRLESIFPLRAEAMMLDVALLVLAVGHFVERQIGDLRQCVVERLGGSFSSTSSAGMVSLNAATSASITLLVLFRPCLLRLADVFRGGIAAGLGGFERENGGAALLVDLDECAASGRAVPRRASARSKASGLSRMKLMSCMRYFQGVMPGLVPGDPDCVGTAPYLSEMAGTSPAMTN